MNLPPRSQQSTAFAQAAATSGSTLGGIPLDRPLLWLTPTKKVVLGALIYTHHRV
jgi:hypothetical protein